MKRFAFLVVLSLHANLACAQMIINAEESRFRTDSMGWTGTASIGFTFNKETNATYRFAAESQLQHKSKKNLWLILGKYSFLEAGSSRFVNRGFVHLRYNRKLGSIFRWEIFNQLQTNRVLKVDKRYLAGTGPRIKFLDSEKLRLYLGILYMFEWEKIIEPSEVQRNHRMSSYLSVTEGIGKSFTLSSTWYYQPRLDLFSDYRIAGNVKLDFAITKAIHFINSFDYLHDSRPAFAIPVEVYSMSNGIEILF